MDLGPKRPESIALGAGKEMQGIDIRIARIRQGLRQEDLAQMVGITQETLSRIERGKLPASAATMRRIETAIEEVSARK